MTKQRILIDSSFLIALSDTDAAEHEMVNVIAKLYVGVLIVPQVVLTEVVYLLKRDLGIRGALEFLESFDKMRPTLQDVTYDDLQRVREIMAQYASAKLDFVDCCIMALSERLHITEVGTLDQRDFSLFRPNHCDFLEILP